MIDNTKEYMVCAAYKTIKDTPHLKYLIDKGSDVKKVYEDFIPVDTIVVFKKEFR